MAITARAAEIYLGTLILDGLLLSDGNYAIPAIEANRLLKFCTEPPFGTVCAEYDYIINSAESIIGYPLTSVKIELSSKPIEVFTLQEFIHLIQCLSLQGDRFASELLEGLVYEGIMRRFDTGFNVACSEKKYYQKLFKKLKNFWTISLVAKTPLPPVMSEDAQKRIETKKDKAIARLSQKYQKLKKWVRAQRLEIPEDILK